MSSLSSNLEEKTAFSDLQVPISWKVKGLEEAPPAVIQLSNLLGETVPTELPPCTDDEQEGILYIPDEKEPLLVYSRFTSERRTHLYFRFPPVTEEGLLTVAFYRGRTILPNCPNGTLQEIASLLPVLLSRFSRELGYLPILPDLSPQSDDVQAVLDSNDLYRCAIGSATSIEVALMGSHHHEAAESFPYQNPIYQLWDYWQALDRISGSSFNQEAQCSFHCTCFEVSLSICPAVPSPNLLRTLVGLCPRIVDLGAGTGFWARCLTAAGAEVAAVEPSPTQHRFFPLLEEETTTFLRRNPGQYDDFALLCWESQQLAESIRGWNGKWIFVVEKEGAGALLHLNQEQWVVHQHSAVVPSWAGVPDRLTVYRRCDDS